MIVKLNETKEQILRGITIGRLKLNCFLSHGTVNTDIIPTDLDLTKVFVKMILTRNRIDHTIFADKVLFWALDSSLDNNLNYIHPLNTTAANMVIILAKGVAVKEQALIPVILDLPGVVNVKDSDQLKIEISLGSGAFASGIDSAVSYVDAEFEQFIGYEEAIPKIKIFSINASESSFSPAIGNDVVKISFINTDKNSILEADAPIQSVSLKSDKYSCYSTWRQLLCRRFYDIVTPTEAGYLRQSHLIYLGNDLDGGKLDVQLESSNINSGKNAIVVQYLEADLFTANRALEMSQKHSRENIKRIVGRAGADAQHIVNNLRGRI